MDEAFLAPGVAAAAAEKRLARKTAPFLARLWPFLLRPLGNAPVVCSRLELAFLPCAEIMVVGPAVQGPKTRASLLVHGYSRKADVANLDQLPEMPPPLDTTVWKFPLREIEAMEIARQHLLRLRLGRAAPLPRGVQIDLVLRRVVQYPWWVRYATTPRGVVRFALLDAVTGRLGDTFAREGFLKALRLGAAADARPLAGLGSPVPRPASPARAR